MKRKIEVFDYAKEILSALPKGVLLTTKLDGKVNTMTIGWGALGYEWRVPIFQTYVRESRCTFQMLAQSSEFTVNIPWGDHDPKILSYAGSRSGRDTDKIQDLGLTLEMPEVISTPGIREFPLTLECRVVYKNFQSADDIDRKFAGNYPEQPELNTPNGPRDQHHAFYGEILTAYIIE